MTVENNFGLTQLVSEMPTQQYNSQERIRNPDDELESKIYTLKEQIEQTVQVLEKQLEEDVASKKFDKAHIKSFTNRKSELMIMKMENRLPMNSK